MASTLLQQSRTLTSRVWLQASALMLLLALPMTGWSAPDADIWDIWDRSNPQSTEQVNHELWQGLLDEFVVTLEDNRTAFRYVGLASSGKTAQLEKYLAQLTAIDPRQLQRDEQMAYWVNLYNALTVQVVLAHPKKESILRMGGGWLPRGPWDDDVTTIAGETLTLNDIEHRILRPIWQDHRIHFAVNCASIGCPNLATEAFTADRLESQLQAAEVAFLGHPRALQLAGDELRLSSIFDWYMSDFGADRDALLRYLAQATGRSELADHRGDLDFHYNWKLNSAP